MKYKEIDLYKCENIDIKDLSKRNSKDTIIAIVNNLKRSIKVLKNYAALIFINKKIRIENQIGDFNELSNIFKKDLKNYIKKYKNSRKNMNEIKDKIIIDNVPHEIHMNIRAEFLKIIVKGQNNEQNVYEFIRDNILLRLELFQVEDKKNFLNIFSNKAEIINDLLIEIEQINKNTIFNDINDLLFYEYLILEINHLSKNANQENYLEYKEKKNENNLRNYYEIISINMKLI
jgi:hypothetical protein